MKEWDLEFESQPGIYSIDRHHPKDPDDVYLQSRPGKILQVHRNFVDSHWNSEHNKNTCYQPCLQNEIKNK